MSDGLRAAAAALAAGETTSEALVGEALARIDAAQPVLNAFRVVRHEQALADASAADARLAAGERLALLGVPVAIKDDSDIVGEATPFGCAGDWAPCTADGGVVRKLRAAGAVIVGKTTTPEFGQWPFTESIACGPTRNPWNLDHTPGGSSGGSAAAVAAGLVPAAVGSDGAGSVRIPAAWTGLVGLKPQRDRISTFPDADMFNGLTVHGPLARTVADAALLLDVLAGPQLGDRHTPPAPDEPFAAAAARDPGRLRIAVSYRAPFSGVRVHLDPEIRSAVGRLGDVLAGLGHEVFEAEPRYAFVGSNLAVRGITGLLEWEPRVPDVALLDPRTREAFRTGRRLRPLLGLMRRSEVILHRTIGAVFGRADVVLAPTTALPPPRVGAFDGLAPFATDQAITRACPYAYAWNVTGWPGLNVPAGLTAEGLPIGAQLLGPANAEARLLSLGAQLEAVERWDERRPPA